eukprot:CAMPEP_0171291858 /NCGR_PEP_ID=MMETSP0790-20130122/71863_1 /TAXON_ID=2925 /ORGANISM="Alexandrium catenella, Strain OF101" /LENGTH=535 /DNA_ID=CAMNT_0011761583 /DNA_START=98 /DNA_END=1707 /DNA_ORIENTATION=+
MAGFSMAAVPAFVAIALMSMVGTAQASAFRGSGAAVATGRMSAEELRAAMLDELMAALGEDNKVTEGRLQAIEEALRPMFRALHKNEHGHLDHAGVRYALHRLFVLRHGMFIKGLEPGGAGWTSASPTEVLDERVPAYVQGLFEQRLNGRGLGLHEVAKAAEDVIDTYMAIFLMGVNTTGSSVDIPSIVKQKRQMDKVYPSWPESQQFTREVQKEVVTASAADASFSGGSLSFNATSRVVEEIMERYGRWQDAECKSLKSALMALEDQGSGRVLLKDFYGSAQGGTWQFTESVAYLKSLGALDDASEQRQSVVIPNYINSHSNCLASSSIYSVCCLNECEPLLGHLEREVGEPDAAPERDDGEGSKGDATELRGRLTEIAGQHGGRVPLHGRLFGEWLHYAYPRECPYPHRSGTTNPMTADEWIAETGGNNLATNAEMQEHIEAANATGTAATATTEPSPLMWTAEEELVVSTTVAPTFGTRRLRSCLLSSFMALAALASLTTMLWSNLQGVVKALGLAPKHGGLLPFAGKAHYC